MHLWLCRLFSQYSKEIRNDTEGDEYVEDNNDDDDDCKRGREGGRRKDNDGEKKGKRSTM